MKRCFIVVGQARCCFFNILATSKVTPGWVPSCDSARSWWLYSVASLGHQATSTMACYPIHSHYPDTGPIYPNNAECQARKQQVSILKSSISLDQSLNLPSPDSNQWGSDSQSSSKGDRCSTHFATPSGHGLHRDSVEMMIQFKVNSYCYLAWRRKDDPSWGLLR